MSYSKKYVWKKLGPDAILWINPVKIEFDVGTKWPNTKNQQRTIDRWGATIPLGKKPAKIVTGLVRRFDSFIIRPESYRSPRRIEDLDNYCIVRDVVDKRHRMEQSLWYRRLTAELEKYGCARHKGIRLFSRADIDHFFQGYVRGLIESMESSGYDLNKGGAEFGSALVAEDGSLHKSGSGYHRFFVARLVGVPSFPLLINGVHQAWFERQMGEKKNLSTLGRALKRVAEQYR